MSGRGMRNAYNILVEKSQEKRPLERLGRRWSKKGLKGTEY